jgi:hypothetical protein
MPSSPPTRFQIRDGQKRIDRNGLVVELHATFGRKDVRQPPDERRLAEGFLVRKDAREGQEGGDAVRFEGFEPRLVGKPSPTSVRLRLIWLIQALSGSGAMPGMWMRRVAKSMRKSTANRASPTTGPDVHRTEIRGGQDLPMSLQELCPRRLFQPIRRGLQVVLAKDRGDRASGDLVIEVREGSLDPR